MKYRMLGQAAVEISVVGLGCMPLTPFYGIPDKSAAIAAVHRAIELGITHFDTSDTYTNGENEELVGAALKAHRKTAFIASKFGQIRRPDGMEINGRLRHPDPLAVAPDSPTPVISARACAADLIPNDTARGFAILFDQDHGAATYGVADKLAQMFERVVLVTPRPQIAQRVNYCSAIGVYRRLFGAGVEIEPAYELVQLNGRRLICRNAYVEREKAYDDVDLLVYATPRSAVDELAHDLADLEMHLVGDCQSPRDLMAAIHGGHAIGNLV